MSERAPYFRCDAAGLLSMMAMLSSEEALLFTHLYLRVMDKGGPVSEDALSLRRRTGLTAMKVNKALSGLLGLGWVQICPDRRLDIPYTHAEIARQQTSAAQREFQGRPQRNLPTGYAEIKKFVFARDGQNCAYCGDTGGPFDIDHVVPYSRGGVSTADNLCVACKPCNQAKGAKLLAEWLS